MSVPSSADPRFSARGVVLYDGHCGVCSRWVNYWATTLKRHGFEIASLDESWVKDKLQMRREELLTEIGRAHV